MSFWAIFLVLHFASLICGNPLLGCYRGAHPNIYIYIQKSIIYIYIEIIDISHIITYYNYIIMLHLTPLFSPLFAFHGHRQHHRQRAQGFRGFEGATQHGDGAAVGVRGRQLGPRDQPGRRNGETIPVMKSDEIVKLYDSNLYPSVSQFWILTPTLKNRLGLQKKSEN